MAKKNLFGMTADEILRIIQSGGFDLHHAVSITNAIYKKRIEAFPAIPQLPGRLREFLEETSFIEVYKHEAYEASADGTIKYLFRSPGGMQFETIYIPDAKRNTVCVSTQSGCRMGCPFCVTGRYGFYGNLTTGDILNQVLSIPGSEKVTHVVFMGMGEPLDNLENVLKACEILTAEWGMAKSPGNITVSTVGVTPSVKTFLEKSSCNLALSLYSPFPDERVNVVPAESRYPVNEIIEIMKSFPVKKNRRLSVAFVMISNVNDTDKHLDGLKNMLKDSNIRINLLPYHHTDGDLNRSSSEERMQSFRHKLVISGISASIRKSRGTDISAACGLLASGLKRGVLKKTIKNE
jgi:23S rRNA (adenine2503-C2)-methyltransferase